MLNWSRRRVPGALDRVKKVGSDAEPTERRCSGWRIMHGKSLAEIDYFVTTSPTFD